MSKTDSEKVHIMAEIGAFRGVFGSPGGTGSWSTCWMMTVACRSNLGCGFVVAALARLIYDWVLTLGQEVELIWVRYLGIIFAVGFIMYLTRDWMSVVVNAILDVIMITRLHAMYQRSRKVLILLIAVFLFINLFARVIGAISTRNISGAHWRIPEELILSGIYQCGVTLEGNVKLLYSIGWIFGTVWEVLALCLAVWIAIKHFRELRRQSAGGIIGDCFTVLMKTHVGYFASFSLFLFFSPIFEDPSSLEGQILGGFLVIFDMVEMFVLGPRLILGVREYHAKLVADSDTATAMTSIAFQERVHVSTSSSV
ncbi:hypothetical protein DFH29DRAFT_1015399 [Suillus ampliporus]|nr:hypothetical protein DFH29DRAFT_1015399 [Suillus ampliporus]